MPWDCCSVCAKYGSGSCDENVVINREKDSEMLLPAPECELGYPQSQLENIFTPEKFKEFFYWMRGQTIALCDGRQFIHEERRFEPTGCGPHGYVFYPWDVERFLDGRPIID